MLVSAWDGMAAKALDHLHEKPYLHRDVSWGNIMIRRNGEAALVDLGLSRDLPRSQSGLSIEGIGTRAFLAP
jgi:serine/threonine protein kinase